jgi:hypothetical protein
MFQISLRALDAESTPRPPIAFRLLGATAYPGECRPDSGLKVCVQRLRTRREKGETRTLDPAPPGYHTQILSAAHSEGLKSAKTETMRKRRGAAPPRETSEIGKMGGSL